MNQTAPIALTVEDLEAGYGARAVVTGVTLHLETGACLGLVGANGAGKSTALGAIVGHVRAGAGQLVLGGRRFRRWTPEQLAVEGVVFIPQGRGNVLRSLTVEENLRLAGSSIRDGAPELGYALFPRLAERRAQHANTLSGGEQQMLAIALGLALRPKVLLIDEPSAGLAPSVLEEIVRAIGELRRTGVSMIVAEQRRSVVARLCDEVHVVARGKVRRLEG